MFSLRSVLLKTVCYVARNKFERICSSTLFFSFVFDIYVPDVTLVIGKTARIVI